MSLDGAIQHVAGVMGALSGVRRSSDYPPSATPTGLEAITYSALGTCEYGVAGEQKALHDLTTELLLPLTDLARNYETLTGYIEPASKALMADPTLGGQASTFQRATYTLGPEEWGGKQYLVLRFTLVGAKIASAL